ncbi:NmrA family transcriptional regulator [Streptomyces sp. WAC05374]|uniref:NmrA family NAD(P)-binding protein n=1 Tax=Streptomyces sp. WAC05374 TaxID=2487420 RepID=UPI000F887958|nr:NmrA family NAD(P)-binding protein [Streptomyces sp. WAC05374]RST15780.1 NmrA family transcriptional regulator [Streptomyces sp. WAC05374]TDF39092.1 NmrA family transcriptional regulator [Streptomyces sp. WAC05374]TDF47485.1 NmrA family transcriptional regulator [Streptomyces sp. WAC05374]TDF48200.1 NmrA family transcriptional regulator [Streptomyces sp. WAC05374]
MTNTQNAQTTLVIGGTGKTGRRVAERLTARGLPVRVGSRSAEIPFVWEDPGTWDAALEGVGSVYVTYYPDLAFPGAAEAVGAFSKAAVAKGARRLVLLSGRGEEGAVISEDKLKESGADWTVVRANWFNQNFNESFFLEPVLAGELALPTAEAVEPFVDADDIADVVTAALTDDKHIGKTYELSGPRLLSFHDVAAELSKATGRQITYVPVSLDDYRAVLQENGLPVEFADLFGLILDGRNASVVHGVEEAIGRKPKDFSDFAKDAAASGVWNV